METLLIYVQIAVSILLSLAVLLQNRSAGLGAAFGGTGGFSVSKRGAEKVLSNITIVLTVVFVANTIFLLFV